MHASITITDGVYGILSEMDVREQIGSLGIEANRDINQDLEKFIQFVNQLKNKSK